MAAAAIQPAVHPGVHSGVAALERIRIRLVDAHLKPLPVVESKHDMKQYVVARTGERYFIEITTHGLAVPHHFTAFIDGERRFDGYAPTGTLRQTMSGWTENKAIMMFRFASSIAVSGTDRYAVTSRQNQNANEIGTVRVCLEPCTEHCVQPADRNVHYRDAADQGLGDAKPLTADMAKQVVKEGHVKFHEFGSTSTAFSTAQGERDLVALMGRHATNYRVEAGAFSEAIVRYENVSSLMIKQILDQDNVEHRALMGEYFGSQKESASQKESDASQKQDADDVSTQIETPPTQNEPSDEEEHEQGRSAGSKRKGRLLENAKLKRRKATKHTKVKTEYVGDGVEEYDKHKETLERRSKELKEAIHTCDLTAEDGSESWIHKSKEKRDVDVDLAD